MFVTLTEEQLSSANQVAQKRNQVHRRAGRADGKVLADSLEIDKMGAAAELAVSLSLGFPWDGRLFSNDQWLIWRDTGHDTGPLEVRSTKHPNGRLILHPKDHDKSPFVLVRLHRFPVFDIVGWCFGEDGKQKPYWHDVGYGRPCFFVPNQELRPIDKLLELFR